MSNQPGRYFLEREKGESAIFLMPLFLSKSQMADMDFKNSFLKDVHRAHSQERLVYALFRPTNPTRFNRQLQTLYSQGLVVDDYDYDRKYVMVVFQVPDKYKDDYELFLQGKYTQFSENFKKEFPEKVVNYDSGYRVEEYSLHFHVFNKTSGIKIFLEEEFQTSLDGLEEYWTKVDLEKEVFDIDNI